ncbi:MAG: hypothetical protein A2W25_16225 [candidate division Zixibacteria bacterium RBG_16_53_22]|nr:MAG: hypothetical protein A2W25_16225 [candidate division Zixibacteria bacterium RBG_16_53_22]
MDSRLTLVGAALFAGGILLLAYMLFRIARRIGYRANRDALHRPPKSPGLLILLPALFLIVAAQGFFWLSSQLEYFRPMRDDGFVGWVHVDRQPNSVKTLWITYTPLFGDSMGIANSIYLSGDSWRLSGEILNFKFANEFLKLPARACKVTRFNSRYMKRAPSDVAGAMFAESGLDGGPSMATSIFRESPLWRWFATADSFGTDYWTTEKTDEFAIRVRPDRSVVLVERERAEPAVLSGPVETSIIADSGEASAIPESIETSIVMDSSETSVVPDSIEASAEPESVEISEILDSSETPAVPDSNETSAATESIEILVIPDSTEIPAGSDSSEASAGLDSVEMAVSPDSIEIPADSGSNEEMEGGDTL